MTLEHIARALDVERQRSRVWVADAKSPAERDEWQAIVDDLDGAAALVRRAIAVEHSMETQRW